MASPLRIARVVWCAVSVAAALPFFTPAPAHAATPAEIDAAIEKGKAFLYKQQHDPGNWEKDVQRRGSEHDIGGMQGDVFGGYTAIATYALLATGESAQEPRLAKAIQFLQNADIIGIYSLGMRANVWALLPPSRSRVLSDRDARLIMFGMQTGQLSPATKGFWDYGNGRGVNLTGSKGGFDHSVSQYGVLGLWACAENDAIIERSVWELIDAGWKSHQFPDGGWAYDSLPGSGRAEGAAMAAAGVATLFITDEMLNANRGIDCHGNIVNEPIERGLNWVTKHFNEVDNPYAFYGIERIGAASGRKYFGSTDWFTAGAESIVRGQLPDGSWVGNYPGGDNPVPSTAFALLFLTRGRAPVMINKLQYEMNSTSAAPVEGNWNQRPRDVANLVRWTSRQLERSFNWQIVNLKAPIDDLHEAPILYISGDQDLRFTPDEEAKLREFVESGGMILANADCGRTRSLFSNSFEALGKHLFPRYDFRDLPYNHPIFSFHYDAIKWKTRPRLRGLSNGVREMMLLIPDADAARGWQLRDPTQLASFQFGADIFLYAVDKQNLSNRGVSFIIPPNEAIIAERSARIAQLVIGDNNYDPEPGGWRRLGALIHNQFKLDIEAVPVKLGDPRLSHFRMAHLTGTDRLVLTPAARQQLIEYVQHGGTLVVDAAGGNAEFAESAARELKSCFGAEAEAALQTPLDPASPVFRLPGLEISTVTFRDTYRRQVVGKLKTPRLNGIAIGNRIGVFFSREDLVAGMVGEQVGAIAGYSPQSATELMRNIVLYSAFGIRPGAEK